MCTAGVVHAEIAPAFYDFEDYTIEHSSPPGWTSSNVWELSPGKVDDAHGTSLRVENKGLPGYTFSEPLKSGKFLISFEIYFADNNQNLRIHAKSPSSGSDAHSLIRFDKGRTIQSANSQKDAWIFDILKETEVGKWYQIDMLLDMDEKQLHYYIDGADYGAKKLNVIDISNLIFRTEEGESGAVLYLDNVSYKYLSPGSFDTTFGRKTAESGSDTVTLSFSDLVDKKSLNDIKIYNMGTNLVSYNEQEVSYTVAEIGAKRAALKLGEPLKSSSVYKVYAPGIKTMFGDGFTNDTVYFSTGGGLSEMAVINADFSTIPEFTLPMQPVNPESDTEWTKSGNSMVYPVYVNDFENENTAVVRFAPHQGSKKYTDNQTMLTRTADTPITGNAIIEFKMKSVVGNQCFRIKDSADNAAEIINIKDGAIYSGETKIADISSEKWFVIRLDANFADKTMTISKDGAVIAENVGISALADAAAFEFEQRNSGESYKNPDFLKEMYADSYLAYFTLSQKRAGTSVSMITFEDSDGNVIYPDGNVTSAAAKMRIRFSDGVNERTLKNGVSLMREGSAETLSGKYDRAACEYVVEFPEYLAGTSEYTLKVDGTVKDGNDMGIVPFENSFNTADGIVKAKALTISKGGGKAVLDAGVIHTNKSCPDLYLILAAYKDDEMISFKYKKTTPAEDERKVSVSAAYDIPEDAEYVSAFLWDGFDSMLPMIKMQTAE